jgi:hypothetical protein
MAKFVVEVGLGVLVDWGVGFGEFGVSGWKLFFGFQHILVIVWKWKGLLGIVSLLLNGQARFPHWLRLPKSSTKRLARPKSVAFRRYRLSMTILPLVGHSTGFITGIATY